MRGLLTPCYTCTGVGGVCASNAIEVTSVTKLIVRKLSDELHRALGAGAAQRGRGRDAEVQEMLASAVGPEGRVKLGSLLAGMGRQVKLSDEEFEVLAQVREKTPAHPTSF